MGARRSPRWRRSAMTGELDDAGADGDREVLLVVGDGDWDGPGDPVDLVRTGAIQGPRRAGTTQLGRGVDVEGEGAVDGAVQFVGGGRVLVPPIAVGRGVSDAAQRVRLGVGGSGVEVLTGWAGRFAVHVL